MNSIHTIPIKWNHKMRTWTFNDIESGIKNEPFVFGFEKILSKIARHHGIQFHAYSEGMRLIISESLIPDGYKATLILPSETGAWYIVSSDESLGQGCLSYEFLSTFDFFLTDNIPDEFYLQVVAS